jgi:DNA repair protein RecO (recombination protein O)
MNDRQRVYRTRAVVLRRRDYRDADRVLTVFTPEFGKQELIAKGIRKTTSRKAGHLELFTHSSLMLARARTWDIITEAVTIENYRHLRQDLDSIGRASYVCELVDNFTEADDENRPMYELLLVALRQLDEQSAGNTGDPGVLLRWFELQTLNLTGFQPQLFQCIGCGAELEPVRNRFSLEDGGVFCPNCGQNLPGTEPIEADVLKILRFLQSHPWNEVSRLSVRPQIMRQTDSLLYRYILTVLERHLKSADFLRHLQLTDSRRRSAV